MTYKLTIRTAPGALIAAEYLCPVHGRFAIDVPRGADGDPPAARRCPHLIAASPSFADSEFSEHAYLQMPERTSHCGRPSPHVISAPGTAKVRRVEAVRGSYAKPEFETYTNCENLGEGQDLDDWKADRAKVWEREREREAMELAREL